MDRRVIGRTNVQNFGTWLELSNKSVITAALESPVRTVLRLVGYRAHACEQLLDSRGFISISRSLLTQASPAQFRLLETSPSQ